MPADILALRIAKCQFFGSQEGFQNWKKSYCLTLGRLPALKSVLQEIAKEHSGDRTIEALSLLAQIDFDFSVNLVIFSQCLSSHIQ